MVLFEVLFDLRVCIFQWDIADHEISSLFLPFQDLLHVNRTPIVLAHIGNKACLRVFFLVVGLHLRNCTLTIVVNIIATPSMAVNSSHHKIVDSLSGQVVNKNISLVVHGQLLELGIRLPLSLHRFCLVSVNLSFEKLARTKAAAIRLSNGLTPFIDFIIPLRSDW